MTEPHPPFTLITQKKGCEYKFYTEFQSHEPEFDYLKSLEIEEKINKIKWCRRQNAAHFLLSTNGPFHTYHPPASPPHSVLILFLDKTIKLWKVFEKSLRVVSESNLHDGQRQLPPPTLPAHLRLPRMTQQDNIIAAVPRKVYSNAHAYHIHSISVNSDQETYISADDLRINLWNLNISDQSFSTSHIFSIFRCVITLLAPPDIVDIKPANMEELTEVITAAEFHPSQCNMFMYSSSKSNIKLADMRESALCDRHAKSESLGPRRIDQPFLTSLTYFHPVPS